MNADANSKARNLKDSVSAWQGSTDAMNTRGSLNTLAGSKQNIQFNPHLAIPFNCDSFRDSMLEQKRVIFNGLREECSKIEANIAEAEQSIHIEKEWNSIFYNAAGLGMRTLLRDKPIKREKIKFKKQSQQE